MVELENNVVDDTASLQPDSKPDAKRVVAWRGALHILLKMLSDILLIGFILTTIFTYVQNWSEPLTSAAKKPEPFFSSNTSVRDYYRGDVFTGFKDASVYENAFFMFYAPWDRESQEARAQLEQVAQFFHGTDILIAAVNCWYPQSECAKEFVGRNSTLESLPLLIFYPKHQSGIQYRSYMRASSIIRFLQKSRFPLTHLHSAHQLQQLQVEYENVLVGYLPNTTTYQLNPNHKKFIATAFSLLEAAPENPVGVALVTSPLAAKQLHLHPTQPVRLFTHNTTFVYPNKTLDVERLVVWTLTSVSQTVHTSWLHLSGTKSRQLKKTFDPTGNVLMLFGPRTEHNADSLHHVLRQVITDYMNCDNSESVENLVSSVRNSNDGYRGVTQPPNSPVTTSPGSCQLRRWSYDRIDEAYPACTDAAASSCLLTANNGTAACHNRRRPIPAKQLTADGHLVGVTDVNIQILLQEVESQRQMEKTLEYEYSLGTGRANLSSSQKSEPVSLTGLGCSANKTLRMYRVDSDLHRSVLASLGLEDRELPLPVIVNTKEESVYIPTEIRKGYFEEDLRRFILAWQGGWLVAKQGYRSTNKDTVVRYKGDSSSLEGSKESVINEVSAESFSRVISATDEDVVLLYTSSFCSLCTSVSFAFHSVKLYLHMLPNISFVIIDATKNDLDWQFTALSYPSIIVFPKNRSEMSRAFPTNLKVSVRSLMWFLLSNLSPANRLRVALTLCRRNCRRKTRLQAVYSISNISAQLRRKSPVLPLYLNHKLIRRLTYLKTIVSSLETIDDEDTPDNKNEAEDERMHLHLLNQIFAANF